MRIRTVPAIAVTACAAALLVVGSLWSTGAGAYAASGGRRTSGASPASNSSSSWPGAIAFSQCNADGSSCQVAVAGPDGSGATTLTSSGFNADPAWSPDGTKIAFASGPSASRTQIDVMNADGSGVTQLTSMAGAQTTPAWSTDGAQIAFTSTAAGNPDVWTMNADGSGLTQLTHKSSADSSPSWSPDRIHIAFQSNRSGNNDVWTMKTNGRKVTQLTHKSTFDGRPAWSPDGGAIAFSSTRSGNMDVWLVDPDGTSPRTVTTASASDDDPAWSPNGAEVVFRSNRSGATALWAVGRTGTFPAHQLTDPSGQDRAPDWQAVPGTDWSRYQFDNASTGDNELETTIDRTSVAGLHQAWDATLPGTGMDVEGSPVVVDGVVYVAAGGDPGGVFALDAFTGAVLWSAPIADQGGMPSTPAVSNGILYTGYDTMVWALDTTTGSTMWTRSVGQLLTQVPPPVVVNGLVFVGGGDTSAELFELDATTGSVARTIPVDDLVDGAAAVSGGVVFVQTRDSTLAFDATSGAPTWSHANTAQGGLASSPAVSGGQVLYTYGTGSVACDLAAVSSTDGTGAWTDPLGFAGCDELSVAVRGSRVFLSAGATLSSYVTGTGRSVWSVITGGTSAVPSVAGGVVYSICDAGDACGYDTSTGDLLWSAGLTTQVASAPVVDNGMLFVGANGTPGGAHVYAFRP